jgi:hypothetical protein
VVPLMNSVSFIYHNTYTWTNDNSIGDGSCSHIFDIDIS